MAWLANGAEEGALQLPQMKNTIQTGTPYVRNSNPWLDEEEVASVKHWIRTLLYKRLMLSCMFISATCVYGEYENSWTANSAVRTLENGSKRSVPITWHVGGDLDEIGDPRGIDLSGKVPDTYKNIHIKRITYQESDTPFDLEVPHQATWLSHGAADTTYPAIQKIDATAFQNCNALLTIKIPLDRSSGISSIGMPCFLGCQNLTAITKIGHDGDIDWSQSMSYYHTEGGVLYNNTRTCLKKYPEGKTGEVFFVPPGIMKLDDYCFAKTRFLKSVVFTENVPEMGKNVFADSSIRTIYNAYRTEEWDDFSWKLPSRMKLRNLSGTGEFLFVIKIYGHPSVNGS